MENQITNKIRYAVEFNGRNYERVLHSKKELRLRNIADVLNVIEYCLFKELTAINTKNGGKVDESIAEKITPTYSVTRFKNDEKNLDWDDADKFKSGVDAFVKQMIVDFIDRNTEKA